MCIVSGVVNTLYSGFLIVSFDGQLSWCTARFASGIAYAVWIALVLTLRYLLYIYTLVKMYFTRRWTFLVLGNFVDAGHGTVLYVEDVRCCKHAGQ